MVQIHQQFKIIYHQLLQARNRNNNNLVRIVDQQLLNQIKLKLQIQFHNLIVTLIFNLITQMLDRIIHLEIISNLKDLIPLWNDLIQSIL